MIKMVSFFSQTIFGVPYWFLIALVGGGLAVWWIAKHIKREKKPEEFKPIVIKKEVIDTYKKMISIFGVGTNKTLSTGLNHIGFVLSSLPLFWDENLNEKENLERNANINKSDEVKKAVEGQKQEQNLKEMFLVSRIDGSLFSKIKALFGAGITYIFLEKDILTFNPREIIISPYSSPHPFYDTYIYSKVGKSYVENVPFRVGRESELEELANQAKKISYIDTHQASKMEGFDVLENAMNKKAESDTEIIRKAKV